MVQKSQTQEKFAAQWNPRFPNPFPKGKMNSAHKKNGLLADFHVYVPELVNFHVCWSCTSGCRTISSAHGS